jgi:hypothetical protein
LQGVNLERNTECVIDKIPKTDRTITNIVIDVCMIYLF